MNLSDFDYDLPSEYIAQTPLEPRDSSRLLVIHRGSSSIEHTTFKEIGRFLNSGDLLVLNQTRVIPARLFAHKPTGGRVELLLLRREGPTTWETLVGGKGMTTGRQVQVECGPEATIVDQMDGGRRMIRFSEPIEPFLNLAGSVPLPPYIHEPLRDPERYQTIYAKETGSAAAPTAGLHFTENLLDNLLGRGIKLAKITLHVGMDTFAPVTEENPETHKIHSEWCEIPSPTVESIREVRAAGKRVIAVGTTSVRSIESSASEDGIKPFSGNTNLFILPGYKFKLVDGMVTNFHLPKSTLIMLVSAFAGRELILEAYEEAKRNNYRFYSFGDAMLIL